MDWIAEYNDNQLLILEELPDEEKAKIESATIVLNKLLIINNPFEELNSSFEEYKTWFIQCGVDDAEKLVILVRNYLNNYYGFVCRWETYLKRNKNETMLKLFKESIKTIYDHNFEYRFIYNLRNYAQHCGNPISNVSESINNEFDITMDRDMFLAEHTKMQKKLIKELKTYEKSSLDVDYAIRRVHELLIELQNKLLTAMAISDSAFLSSAVEIAKFYNTYNKENGTLYLLDNEEINELSAINKSQDEAELSTFMIPIQLARFVIKGAHPAFSKTHNEEL